MNNSIDKKLNYFLHSSSVARFVGWIGKHHFWFSLVAHCGLFAASYVMSFQTLDAIFDNGEAETLLLKTIAQLVLIRTVVFICHDLYEGYWVYLSFEDLLNIIRASVISSLIFALTGFFGEQMRIPHKIIYLDVVFCVVLVYGVRVIFTVLYTRANKATAPGGQKILLAGPIGNVRMVAEEILSDPLSFYSPVGIIDTSNHQRKARLRISDLPVISIGKAISEKERFKKVRHIVLCLPEATKEKLESTIQILQPLNIPFTILPSVDEVLGFEGENDLQALNAVKDGEYTKSQRGGGAYKRLYLSPPHMGGLEPEYVRRAFQSNFIAPVGPMVDSFEQAVSAITGAKYTLALSSGTAAIHLALKVIGVGQGDTVITSTLTFIGGVTPIVFQGATPIFIDCDRKTWNLDLDLLARTLEQCACAGKLPKAVIPTDLYGQCTDYHEIMRICGRYGVPVIVDSAEAVGATCRDQHAGTVTTAGVYSFNGNKIITTSGGGMLVSSDKDFIDQARFLAQQARDPFPYYEHSRIGYNYRMSNILAGIGLAQLSVLHERVNRRREIFNYYKDALENIPGIEFMPEAPYGRSNRWLTAILVNPEKFGADREKVRLALEDENIESRPVWKPMHMQPVFKIVKRGNCREEMVEKEDDRKSSTHDERYIAEVVGGEVAAELFELGLCLPSGTAMTEKDLNRVISVILKCRE